MRNIRVPWQDFPPVHLLTPLGTASKHPLYLAAKQEGNLDAALELVTDLLPKDKVQELKNQLGERTPLIVPVHAQEAGGINKIPVALAVVLADHLKLTVSTEIIQINKPCRTGKGAYYRLVNYPLFEGQVEATRDYLILDDTLAMGGTFASLRGYIESQGGRVILATALTGHPGAANLGITSRLLQKIQEKHGNELDTWWKKQFGFGLDTLTQGEAGHLAKAPDFDTLRERLSQARFEGEC
ncbi:MAG: hypothetical protein BWK78_04220 [Thiotrichaceae bacterium IS1]|nr:MAG: hypothetical protein BWK78_04220 [Thiotrichaceae bacterium IS1]